VKLLGAISSTFWWRWTSIATAIVGSGRSG